MTTTIMITSESLLVQMFAMTMPSRTVPTTILIATATTTATSSTTTASVTATATATSTRT